MVGVYLGYDKPRHLGKGATGGALAAPVVRDFMKVALADKPAVPFRVPAGIKLIRIDPKTGMRAGPGDQRVILEAFKPGTAPPDNYSVIGVSDMEGRPLGRLARSGSRSAHGHRRAVLIRQDSRGIAPPISPPIAGRLAPALNALSSHHGETCALKPRISSMISSSRSHC